MSQGYDLTSLNAAFAARFPDSAGPVRVARAPGRLNLLGEHTDYNGGFVLPIALNRACYAAFAAREGSVRVWAEAYGESDEFNPADPERDDTRLWANYVRGVAWALGEAGVAVPGGDLLLTGDIPLSAGVSSSAAVETACGLAFLALAGVEMPGRDLALLCQKAENQFVGVNCGIMDQFAVGLCTEGHALLLDCRSLETRNVPLAAGAPVFFVLDTAKPRELAESGYNERRAQCESAARHFGVPTLREVTREQIERDKELLGDVVYRRCRHVLTENERVLQALDVMGAGDWAAFGRLLDGSHFSLKDDYEVSCEELDIICALAREQEGCLGARMVGAGFGGCAMAAVERAAVDEFAATLAPRYHAATGREPRIFAVEAAAGAGLCR
ncbi:MAG: galactokinase [Armatimonadetes bacterium]|nr:galactokinase [Armatimonadota bacterium]